MLISHLLLIPTPSFHHPSPAMGLISLEAHTGTSGVRSSPLQFSLWILSALRAGQCWSTPPPHFPLHCPECVPTFLRGQPSLQIFIRHPHVTDEDTEDPWRPLPHVRFPWTEVTGESRPRSAPSAACCAPALHTLRLPRVICFITVGDQYRTRNHLCSFPSSRQCLETEAHPRWCCDCP